MDVVDLLAGESKNVEFKRVRPTDAKKYVKTVVAFANGHGGKIIFGVEDGCMEIIGIPNEILFREMDAIANVISDSCEPMIIPDISLQEIDGKTLIIVEIAPGMQRPYYVKSMGIQEGTFIRVAGTSRPAEPYTLRELLLEGSGRSLDSIPLDDQSVSEKEIEKVCQDMTEYARCRCRIDAERDRIRPLTKNQLMSWELLVERSGKIVPTYGFNLLAGKGIPSAVSGIQCAVFKGKTRAVFVDRRQYDGPIYRQIDDAYDFVLRMIRMGAVIDGIVRQDIYEFPPGTVRKMICNAVCHRSYLQPANVQVALYDDRLEVTSPGMLSRDMTIERMKEGYSKIRNRGIANAFCYMKIMERWGSGIPRMLEECEAYGLKEPELIDAEGDFRINLYRKDAIGTDAVLILTEKQTDGKTNLGLTEKLADRQTNGKVIGKITDTENSILQMIRKDASVTQNEIAERIGLSNSGVRYAMRKMKSRGILKRVGSHKNGKWQITDAGE